MPEAGSENGKSAKSLARASVDPTVTNQSYLQKSEMCIAGPHI